MKMPIPYSFIPKYRKKVLYGRIRIDVREIINTLCQYKNVEIIAGAVCEDHVHLSVAIPPKISISNSYKLNYSNQPYFLILLALNSVVHFMFRHHMNM